MSHRIDYSSQANFQGKHRYSFRVPVLTVFCFFVFLILVHFLWPEGRGFLLEVISLREGMAVFSALDIAAEELSGGGELVEAFRAFKESFS